MPVVGNDPDALKSRLNFVLGDVCQRSVNAHGLNLDREQQMGRYGQAWVSEGLYLSRISVATDDINGQYIKRHSFSVSQGFLLRKDEYCVPDCR